MTEPLFHWIAFLGGIVVQAIIAAYVYGKLTQNVSNNSEDLATETKDRKDDVERIDNDQRTQWGKINDLREDMGKVKGKLGLNGH